MSGLLPGQQTARRGLLAEPAPACPSAIAWWLFCRVLLGSGLRCPSTQVSAENFLSGSVHGRFPSSRLGHCHTAPLRVPGKPNASGPSAQMLRVLQPRYSHPRQFTASQHPQPEAENTDYTAPREMILWYFGNLKMRTGIGAAVISVGAEAVTPHGLGLCRPSPVHTDPPTDQSPRCAWALGSQ